MNNPDLIKSKLLDSINELAARPEIYAKVPGRDFTRNRKLGFINTTQMLLTMEGDTIKEELYRFFGRTPEAPSKAAFHRQRGKLSSKALPALFYSFNRKLQRKLFKGKYQLVACDGSSAYVFRDPKDPNTFFPPDGRSAKGFNLVHINACYSIMDRRFTDIVVQPGHKKNEYLAFCEMVDAAGCDGPPTIYLADMGYASYNNYAHVIENNQFFLIRCNDKRLQGILGQPVEGLKEMDGHIDLILSRTQARRKWSRPDLEDRYRYIAKAMPLDYITDDRSEYDISLRVVRFEIKPGVFENIITNLPDTEFDFEDFIFLYHLRWTQENSFRDLKYPLCLKAFHSRKYEYIVQEIWARAILHNFSSAIITEVEIKHGDTKHHYQANFSEGFKICRDFLRIHDGKSRLEVAGLIRQNIEAIRPGRTFDRHHRFGIPVSFCYRN